MVAAENLGLEECLVERGKKLLTFGLPGRGKTQRVASGHLLPIGWGEGRVRGVRNFTNHHPQLA